MLAVALLSAGFSARTANAIAYGSFGVASVEDLRDRPLGTRDEPGSLLQQLGMTSGVGAQGIEEVEAFRAGLHPQRGRRPVNTFTITLTPAQLAALDNWIEKQPDGLSRLEAIRAIVDATLPSGGLGPPQQSARGKRRGIQ
jgi:hypothetical protein